MKKILLAVCAISLISLVGCKKDDPTPEPQPTAGEGIYNPDAHIATVVNNDGTQQWIWNGDKLDRIESSDNEGNATSVQQFTYNGNRIASISQTISGVQTETRVSYNGNYISAISIFTDGVESVRATVNHSAANKINRVDLNVDASYITNLLGMLTQGGLSFKGNDGRKLTLNSTNIYATFDWEGDDVRRMIVNADINAGITMDDIGQIIDLNAILGDMAALLGLIQGEQPLVINLRDTIDFTYDEHHNPLQGFIGMLDPQVLSANNYILSENRGSAHVNLSFNIPLIPALDTTISILRVSDLFYTYNNAGFPLTVSDDQGNETTYTYHE